MQNNNVYFSVTDEYKDMSDEDLIILIKSGNKCALEFLIENIEN